MLHYSRWKTLAILASVALAMLFALPNALPAAWRDWLGQYTVALPITLGLDLQGGSNVLMEVDRVHLKGQIVQQLTGDIRAALREAKIGYQGINRGDDGVSVRITNAADLDRARTELDKLVQPLDSGGLLSTGIALNLFDLTSQDQQFTFTFSESGLDAKVARAIAQSVKIVESRINALGTTEPTIQQQGKNRIAIQLPGIQDPDRVKDVIGRTAKLTFQLLCDDQPTGTGQNPPPDCAALPLKETPTHCSSAAPVCIRLALSDRSSARSESR